MGAIWSQPPGFHQQMLVGTPSKKDFQNPQRFRGIPKSHRFKSVNSRYTHLDGIGTWQIPLCPTSMNETPSVTVFEDKMTSDFQ